MAKGDGAPSAPAAAPAGGAASAAELAASQPLHADRDGRKLIKAVSARDHLRVLQLLTEKPSVSPNASWKGMLALRTAVLIGDLDMVALLVQFGADVALEPSEQVERPPTDEAPTKPRLERVTLGKCARALAVEMTSDVENPLHHDGRAMLQLMIDEAARVRRLSALTADLEEQATSKIWTATIWIVGTLGTLVVFGIGCYWFITREMAAKAAARGE